MERLVFVFLVHSSRLRIRPCYKPHTDSACAKRLYLRAFLDQLQEMTKRLIRSDSQVRNPLEPLLKMLTKDFIDNADLSEKLRRLYKVCVGLQRCTCLSDSDFDQK